VAVVYTSATAPWALETLVHLNPPAMFNYRIIRLEFDDDWVDSLALAALPSDWKREPRHSPPVKLETNGSLSRSLILAVPVSLSGRDELLANPVHPISRRLPSANRPLQLRSATAR